MILLDFKMPKLNGFQLFRELRKKDNEVKICFFTASEDVDYDEYNNLLSLSVEEKSFIKKPIDMHQLLWLIHQIFGVKNIKIIQQIYFLLASAASVRRSLFSLQFLSIPEIYC